MRPEVKICGLTRPADAVVAATCGASFLGVVFADSRRRVAAERAREILDAARRESVRGVGVFGHSPPDEILRAAEGARLDVLQLHGAPPAGAVPYLRARFPGAIWGVVRVPPEGITGREWIEWDGADALVIDAHSPAQLGGTGQRFDWERAAAPLAAVRGQRPLVLAGGLTPENVERAIATLDPNVVDVSSGVESALGEKDPVRVAEFVRAVRGENA